MLEQIVIKDTKQLAKTLVDGAFVTAEQLDAALVISRREESQLHEVLVKQGFVQLETLEAIVRMPRNIPVVDLYRSEVQYSAMRLVPQEIAEELGVMPLRLEGEVLTIVMQEPSNNQTIRRLASLTRKRIKPVVFIEGDLCDAIKASYGRSVQIEEQLSVVVPTKEADSSVQVDVKAGASSIEKDVAQAPIVRAVDMLLTDAVVRRASDIHLEPQQDRFRVRYRIDGVMQEAASLPLSLHGAIMTRIKVIAELNIAERRRPQDGEFSAYLNGKEVDFRVATIEADYGEMATLRVLDKSLPLIQLAELGILAGMEERYRQLLAAPFGMILISGPTGSGKTTTLYGSVNQLDSTHKNIMTIEDPIEYHFKNINQVQVNRQAGITFAAGLRSAMRQDPDVILVGEIRDQETAQAAVQAALTGHLVLTSIHANDSVGALVRLIDMGIAPFLITSGVIGCVSQRLARRLCPVCQSVKKAPVGEQEAYKREMGEVKSKFAYSSGCDNCSNTGFRGRVGIYELLVVTEQVRTLVAKESSASEIKAQAVQEGLITMQHDGMMKAKAHITTPAEVMRHVFTIN